MWTGPGIFSTGRSGPERWTFPLRRDRTSAERVPGEPAVDGTGDGMLAQELLKDLQETRAKLEAARDEAASLKVLLTLRTHQHDQAWQAVQRLTAEHDGASVREAAAAAGPSGPSGGVVDADAVARADARTEAVRMVLGAVLDSIGPRALDRRRFQDAIAQAGRATPDAGPESERHAVLLTEARRVLGIRG
jgi:hypothetical protein